MYSTYWVSKVNVFDLTVKNLGLTSLILRLNVFDLADLGEMYLTSRILRINLFDLTVKQAYVFDLADPKNKCI